MTNTTENPTAFQPFGLAYTVSENNTISPVVVEQIHQGIILVHDDWDDTYEYSIDTFDAKRGTYEVKDWYNTWPLLCGPHSARLREALADCEDDEVMAGGIRQYGEAVLTINGHGYPASIVQLDNGGFRVTRTDSASVDGMFWVKPELFDAEANAYIGEIDGEHVEVRALRH